MPEEARPAGGPEAVHREALRAGRLILQRCPATGRTVFYPRRLSPWSGDPLEEWVEPSGRGTVHSTTTVRRPPDKGGDYNVALVEFDSGGRMMTRVEGVPPHEVTIGMSVTARIVDGGDGEPLLVFVADAAGSERETS